MSAQHTPGPWRMTHTGMLGVGILPSTGEMRTEGGPIVSAWSAGIGSAEAEANARLIAAAPEMADAIDGLIEMAQAYGLAIDARVERALKVLAKARGEA